MHVAMRRAAHQIFDARPLVLDDPIAVPIIGPEAEARVREKGGTARIGRVSRAFMVARSRYAEDKLAEAVARGVDQYVVLGAGLDTFAYRDPFPQDTLRVFEVDHPATQAWKRWKLKNAGIALPANVTYAPVDFEERTLSDGLTAAGFDATRPAFFSWLGVVMYLTDAAIEGTFRYIASLPTGSGMAFDAIVPNSALNWFERIIRHMISRRVRRVEEPFISFFRPEELRAKLSNAGFHDIEILDPDALYERYFRNRSDGLRPMGHSLLVTSAQV